MAWWANALYDTCSLITLDKILQIDQTVRSYFPGVQALEESFTVDQMRTESAGRIRACCSVHPLPSTGDLAAILEAAQLSKALAQVDQLVFATAIHSGLKVVTADKRLAAALVQRSITVGNVASILKELVSSRSLTQRKCTSLLKTLAEQDELILGQLPPTWESLREYRFPD